MTKDYSPNEIESHFNKKFPKLPMDSNDTEALLTFSSEEKLAELATNFLEWTASIPPNSFNANNNLEFMHPLAIVVGFGMQWTKENSSFQDSFSDWLNTYILEDPEVEVANIRNLMNKGENYKELCAVSRYTAGTAYVHRKDMRKDIQA